MTKKPVSQVVSLVQKRVEKAVSELGGLDDNHLKFLAYWLKYEMMCSHYRLEMNYQSKPKLMTIHVFSLGPHREWVEFYLRPKQVDLLDKIGEYLKLAEWEIEFAKRKI